MQSILFKDHAISLFQVLKYCPELGNSLGSYIANSDECSWPVITSDGDLVCPENLSDDFYSILSGSADEHDKSNLLAYVSNIQVNSTTETITLDGRPLYIDFRQFKIPTSSRQVGTVLTMSELSFSDFRIVNDSDGCYYRGTTRDSDSDETYLYYDRSGKLLSQSGSRSVVLRSNQSDLDYDFHPQDLYNSVDPSFTSISSIIESRKLAEAIENSNKPQSRKSKKAKAIMTTGSSLTAAVKSTVTDNIIDPNKAAALAAGKLEIGSLALDLMTEQVIKIFPEPVQLMIGNSPALKIVVSNIVNLLITQFGIDDARALAVNEAMMTVAWLEAIKQFDIKSMLDEVMSKLPAAKLAALVGTPKT